VRLRRGWHELEEEHMLKDMELVSHSEIGGRF